MVCVVGLSRLKNSNSHYDLISSQYGRIRLIELESLSAIESSLVHYIRVCYFLPYILFAYLCRLVYQKCYPISDDKLKLLL